MDKKRVEEIFDSLGTIQVTYQGDPVWLENLSTYKDGKVKVKNLYTNEHSVVDIADLKE